MRGKCYRFSKEETRMQTEKKITFFIELIDNKINQMCLSELAMKFMAWSLGLTLSYIRPKPSL